MKYEEMPKRPIDANCYCYSRTEEVFLFSVGEILDLVIDTELEPEALELVHIEETKLYELTEDYWDDALEFDNERSELPEWLVSEIEHLNKKIRERPGSGVYAPIDVAVELTSEFRDAYTQLLL